MGGGITSTRINHPDSRLGPLPGTDLGLPYDCAPSGNNYLQKARTSFHFEDSFGFGGGAGVDLILPAGEALIASDQTRASCKREVRPDRGAEDGQPVSKSDEEEDVNGDPC